ncbi:MAG: flagellar basal body-associated FliL family protein [Myxococcota bacterium]|nr:flagellar basal body-associated FliL family protein [Myxococcota bacterium]
MSEEELEQQPSGGGNNKIILILVSVNIVAVLGVLVYLITSQGAAPAAVVVGGEAIAKPAQEEPGAGPPWKMDPLIVNLRVPEGTRYLKVALEFELTGEKFKELAEDRKGRIKDQVIEFLSDLTVDDVVGSDNKQYIKERLLTRLNHSLEGEAGGPVFRRVFFPEFLVQ